MNILLSLFSEFWPYIIGALGVLAAYLGGQNSGKKSERLRQERKDTQNARQIEERVDETIRKHDGDTRPVDERLRDKGRLRD